MFPIAQFCPLTTPQSFFVVYLLLLLFFVSFVQKPWSTFDRHKRNHVLSKIPGPKMASFTRVWILKNVYSYSLAEKCAETARTYGSVVRIGPNHVLISDPADIRKVLAVGSSYTRGPWFDALRLHHDETNIVCERDPERHQRKRNIYSAALLGKGMQKFESTIDEHVRTWMEQIHEQHIPNSKVACDIITSFRYLAVDAVSHLILGTPFGSLKAKTDVHKFIEVFNAGTRVQTCLSVIPELKSLLVMLSHIPVLGGFLAPVPGDGTPIGTVLAAIQDPVKERFAKRGPRVEMLDSFIERGLVEQEAIGDLLLILSAGVETTTNALGAIIYLIVSTPGVQLKLQKEIKSLALSDDAFPARESTIKRAPYFRACVSEGLRLYPPSFQLRERMAPPSGDTLGGYFIPGGTFIGINSKAAQLNDVFGKDVEVFRPERWLASDSERTTSMKRNLELVWNHGSTKCLGMNIATMELTKCIFEVSYLG
ncbi:putative benzoate 4-monooxygenase cytochrome P450 [Lindgomyces ingoldianus]|uniref:Benzoate 4-monooxygenase cytochrome P450 n=1 Tax=Lindgomyces ingoldianus TaxID=673940 RepID=A0ACB6RGM6_9PLEO|nr:putative benzoate 4-monooxygenase cytochrome P450 [Lindgomyces ingoldianus]KAF2478409.1 putative benzoate 4-monooxygenase cytochrome P450 [Lindgomyces ingoldianus]